MVHMSCTHTAPLMSLKFVLSVNTKGILNDLLNFDKFWEYEDPGI